jgi:hypothetical protein
MAILVNCDHCKVPIDRNDGEVDNLLTVSSWKYEDGGGTSLDVDDDFDCDLCRKCFDELKKWLRVT